MKKINSVANEHLPVGLRVNYKPIKMNYLGLTLEQVAPTGEALNQLLANYQIYYQNLRNFHWNVSGHDFFDLHEQFEELYEDARLQIDEIAERILTLRMRPLSTLSAYIEKSDAEQFDRVLDEKEMVGKLLENHRVLIASMRDVIKAADEISDEGTIDLIGGILSGFEKKSWMLDAWYERKNKVVPNEVAMQN